MRIDWLLAGAVIVLSRATPAPVQVEDAKTQTTARAPIFDEKADGRV